MKYILPIALITACCAYGAEQTEPITVTATRDTSPVQKAPYYISSVSSDEITSEYMTRTVPEALKRETGTSIQKTGHGQGSPYIRGFTGYRNLMLVDGIRLNNSTFRDGPNQYWNTIDPLSLSRIELVRGPFSALYGSDAIGGTAECFSRGAQDLPPGKSSLTDLYYRFSSAEDSHQARFSTIYSPHGSTFLTAGITMKDFGELEGGSSVGTQEKTGYEEMDWDIKLEHFTDDNARIVIAHQNVNLDDAWRTHKTIYGVSWHGTTVGNELKRSLDQNRELTYMQYHQVNIGQAVDEVHAGISHHMQAETRDRIRTRNRHDYQGTDVNTIGAFVQLKSPFDSGALIYGIDYYRDNVDSFKNTLNPDGSVKSSAIQGPVADDAAYDTAAAFLQGVIDLDKNSSLLLGGRYERSSVDADKVEDPRTGSQTSLTESWDSVAGNARIIKAVTVDGSLRLFAGISQGFRAPNLSDLTRLDTARTDELETPSPGLDPEKFISYEAGAKFNTDNASAQVALFRTDIKDSIVRTPTGEIIDGNREVTKKNAGDGFAHGLEIQADYKVTENVKIFGAFTWVYGEEETFPTSDPVLETEPFSKLMPPAGHAGIRWSASNDFWMEASCDAADKADELSTADKNDTSRIPPGGTPGYAVYNLRAGWKPTDRLTLAMAIENIGDKDYRIHGSGLNEPGRNFIISVRNTF